MGSVQLLHHSTQGTWTAVDFGVQWHPETPWTMKDDCTNVHRPCTVALLHRREKQKSRNVVYAWLLPDILWLKDMFCDWQESE